MRDKVILINLGKHWVASTSKIIPPTSILPIAGYLEKEGYKAGVFDARLEDYHKLNLNHTLAVGITSMTGRPIKHGIEVCKYIKTHDESIPIIWGGVHSTFLPEQTVSEPYIDFVVRGEGEVTMKELADSLVSGNGFSGIKGLTYKENGKVINNPPRPLMPMDETNDLPYHLLKKKYLREYDPKTGFFYPDSRGCPHRCRYCYNTIFCKSTWRTKSLEKIKEELHSIVKQFDPEHILFMVDNFFVSKKRVENIAKMLMEEGFGFEWSADVRADYFDRFDMEFLNLLKESGCKTLHLGAESGSQRVLDFVKKDITISQTVKAVRTLGEAEIKIVLFFMIGFPTETKEEMFETLNFMDMLEGINNNIGQIISVFTPYPGTYLYDYVTEKYNFQPPKNLEEWGEWMFSAKANISWFPKEYRKLLIRIAQMSRLKSSSFRFTNNMKELTKQVARLPFTTSARFRWKHRLFVFPVEWRVWDLVQKWRGYF